jgi:hypothetical protein
MQIELGLLPPVRSRIMMGNIPIIVTFSLKALLDLDASIHMRGGWVAQ